ncbi:MAG: EH signature domain-containing protein [Hyphomonadaceae bacterium]
MTGLSALLAQPSALVERLKVKAPEPRRLIRAVEQLEADIDERAASAAAFDVGGLQEYVANLIEAGDSTKLTNRELREICGAVLLPPRPPAREPHLLDAILRELTRRRRRRGGRRGERRPPRALMALLEAYVSGFAEHDGAVADLAKALETLVLGWSWRDRDPWPARLRAFDLLDPREAPRRIAEAVLKSPEAPQAVLDEAGLDVEGRRNGGLAEAALVHACKAIATGGQDDTISPQQKILQWGSPALSFPYPRAWPNFAAALFLPWKHREPPADHKSALMDFALSYAGDPRLAPVRWRTVEEHHPDAYDIVVRWLTRASVEQFFNIVGETMASRPDMWNERRQFWTSYLKSGAIHAAWVAFGKDGEARAKRAAERAADSTYLKFGCHDQASSRTSEHAALLMQIGDLTIVDWSHNGRWNIWRTTDANAPRLFKTKYRTTELMSDWAWGAHQNQWQYKVAEIIRQQTGMRR